MGQKTAVRIKGEAFAVSACLNFKRQLRRRPPRCFVKIPDLAAEIVLKSVSEQDAEHVFTLPQIGSEVISIKVHPVIRIADVGGETAFGYFLPVDP